jgi:hypothetical protein
MQYIVLTNLKHNGQKYAPGATVELDETVGTRLVESGTVRDPRVPVVQEADDLSRRVHAVKNGVEPKANATQEMVDVGGSDAPATVEDTRPAVSEDMKREDLEAIAIEEGATQEMVDACKNKGEVLSLIEAGRNPQPKDPSADL